MSVKRAFFSVFQKFMVFCCAIFFGIANAFSALPAGYTELEYIESTGTQYIDTGVDVNSGSFEIDTDMQFTALTSPQYYGIYGGGYFGITDSYFAIGGHGTSVTANKTKHNFVLSSSIGNNKVLTLSIDGTNYTYTRNVAAGRIALLTVLNGSTTMGLMSAKLYSVKIYQNGTLVRDFVPVKKTVNGTDVYGMYNVLDNNPETAFYGNKGTGTFTAGPVVQIRIATTAYNAARFNPVVTDLNTTIATIRDVVTNTINQTAAIADLQTTKQTRPDEQCPAGKKCLLVEDNNGKPHWYEIIENIYGLPAGYTPLEYIRSSGVAYIDTGYSPTSKTRIELVAKMDSGAGNVNIAGSAISTSSGSSSDALLVINSFSDTEYEIKFGASGTWPKGATNMTTKNTFSLSATEFRVNDVVKGTYSGSVPDTGNKPFYLFQRWRPEITSTNSKVQIYEFNIYENGTLVRRMVPAKQGTTVGMYDTVNGMFYQNAGTGTFIAGPEM